MGIEIDSFTERPSVAHPIGHPQRCEEPICTCADAQLLQNGAIPLKQPPLLDLSTCKSPFPPCCSPLVALSLSSVHLLGLSSMLVTQFLALCHHKMAPKLPTFASLIPLEPTTNLLFSTTTRTTAVASVYRSRLWREPSS